MTPSGNITFTLTNMENAKAEAITDAKGSGYKVFIPIATDLDLSFGIIMRYLEAGGTTRHPFAQNQTN